MEVCSTTDGNNFAEYLRPLHRKLERRFFMTVGSAKNTTCEYQTDCAARCEAHGQIQGYGGSFRAVFADSYDWRDETRPRKSVLANEVRNGWKAKNLASHKLRSQCRRNQRICPFLQVIASGAISCGQNVRSFRREFYQWGRLQVAAEAPRWRTPIGGSIP